MSKFNCFTALFRRKKRDKGDQSTSKAKEAKSASFSVPVHLTFSGNSRCKVKVLSHETPVRGEENLSRSFTGESMNRWVGLCTESPLKRVDEWVKKLETQPSFPVNDDDNSDSTGIAVFPPSPRGPSHLTRRPNVKLSQEILKANSVIRSLNCSPTVVHIKGIGLKVSPTLSWFSRLRSVNLSGNSIVHIVSGSLPKRLHTLNLSRNKISTIEGFRELSRLRVLDLSYNGISRIGRGLSNCPLIKELYVGGNKISEVDGLHRLLKLSPLDLSLNKVSTTKALGQLVANYKSLLSLNLLGNPIHRNVSEDKLRKAACSILPKLAYLNNQPIYPHKAREVATESISRAALGSSSRSSSRKKALERVTQGGDSRREASKDQKDELTKDSRFNASELAYLPNRSFTMPGE